VVVALEILVATVVIRNLIRKGKTFQIPSLIQTGQQFGMQSLDLHLKHLVGKGLMTREEALKKALDPRAFGEASKRSPLRRAG